MPRKKFEISRFSRILPEPGRPSRDLVQEAAKDAERYSLDVVLDEADVCWRDITFSSEGADALVSPDMPGESAT